MPRRVTPSQKAKLTHLRKQGFSLAEAARQAKVSYAWAKAFERGLKDTGGTAWRQAREESIVPEGAVPLADLIPEARQALGLDCAPDDWDGLTEAFVYWRLRYTGHISTPWQKEAAYQVIEAFYSPFREYLVINVFPGSGKSTLITDLAAWFICRVRSIRGLFGSRASNLAKKNTRRVRRLLERTVPVKATPEEVELGLAVDAVACLALDYGRFKPTNQEVWRAEEFVVEQMDGTPIEEKESTLTAFGFDQDYLGNRFDFAFWDDIDSLRHMSVDVVEKNREIYDREAEPRVERGGLMVVCQQRLGPSDFSAYNLAKTKQTDDGKVPIYRHIVYRAHYEDVCKGEHGLDAPAWPEGCLLEPVRLPWTDIRGLMGKPQWPTVYQQEDVDPAGVLVPMLWVSGGRGPDGVDYPGCWDKTRGLCELPEGLAPPLYSVVTCDPSPTKFWSVQWWVAQPATELRFLMDLVRQSMDAPDFLDYDPISNTYTGLLEEWWLRARDRNMPFRWLIVEANAAQRFMLQYSHFKRWAAMRGVLLIPHQTHRNKLDMDFGVVASLKPVWRLGRIRLPGKPPPDSGRIAALKLVDEVTRYPGAQTDDCVMAQWFFEYHLNRIVAPDRSKMPRVWRPSWWKSEVKNNDLYERLVALKAGA